MNHLDPLLQNVSWISPLCGKGFIVSFSSVGSHRFYYRGKCLHSSVKVLDWYQITMLVLSVVPPSCPDFWFISGSLVLKAEINTLMVLVTFPFLVLLLFVCKVQQNLHVQPPEHPVLCTALQIVWKNKSDQLTEYIHFIQITHRTQIPHLYSKTDGDFIHI